MNHFAVYQKHNIVNQLYFNNNKTAGFETKNNSVNKSLNRSFW